MKRSTKSETKDYWKAPRRLGALMAWREATERGANETIALIAMTCQPHDELGEDAIRQPVGTSEAEENAVQDGTALATIAVGRPTGKLVGTAPSAQVMPINGTPSLEQDAGTCGVWLLPENWQAAADAQMIENAIAAGIIVVAPARSAKSPDEASASPVIVIGVDSAHLAINEKEGGEDVSIAAYGEAVCCGAGKRDDISSLTGSAPAAALVAGAAALWRAHHGKAAIEERAKELNLSVQALFLTAASKTARCPNRWNESGWGAGMLDAAALIRLPLEDVG